jgi:predicted phage terminase large subunit-like protein
MSVTTAVNTDVDQSKIEAIRRNYWRTSPAMLARHFDRNYVITKHIELISDLLVDASINKGERIMVMTPPRHGKSELCSRWFPAWYLSQFPDHRIILCAYESEFAASWGRKVRNFLMEHGPELCVKLSPDSLAAHRWETTEGGGMVSAGVGGPITGKGANCFLVDDPIKSTAEADSPTIRDTIWEWWRGTAYSRLEPGASVVLIQTRWHEDDLAGRLIDDMSRGGDQWRLINLPAEAEEGDILGRSVGEPLWPERYNKEELVRKRRAMGSRSYTALYQQRPAPQGGGLFKREWFRYYESGRGQGVETPYYVLRHAKDEIQPRRVLKEDCWRFATADLAMTEKTMSDYTVIQVWDVVRDTNDMILVDQWRAQKEAPDVEDQLMETMRRWQTLFIGIESKQSGIVAIQRFKKDGLTVKELKADRDKIARAVPAEIWMENGKVWFPLDAPWLSDLENELLVFPNGTNDDQVDTTAYACAFANARNLWRKKPMPKLPANSIGKLLGMDKIFGPKPKKPLWYKDRSGRSVA